MAADPIFQQMDKIECRKRLGLPADKKLIGYTGSTLVQNRGLDILFKVFADLRLQIPDILLILTGKKGPGISIPSEANWLGYIPDADMPLLLNSLDLLVVMNQQSAFGNYSYPVKLYEAMRCQVPVVVTETLSTKWIMRLYHDLLIEPGNADKLCDKIKSTLLLKKIEYQEQLGWEQIGLDLETFLNDNLGQIS